MLFKAETGRITVLYQYFYKADSGIFQASFKASFKTKNVQTTPNLNL